MLEKNKTMTDLIYEHTNVCSKMSPIFKKEITTLV